MRSASVRMLLKMLCLSGVCLLAGCRHKPVVAVVPPVAKGPVDLVETPAPAEPTLAPEPLPKGPVPVASVVYKELKRQKRRPVKAAFAQPAAPSPPVQVAAVEAPAAAESVIGALTAGGDSTAQKQETVGVISENDKRLAGLSAEVLKDKQTQIAQVKDFQKKARAALDSGDVEGAMTLATKAKVLLDDLLS